MNTHDAKQSTLQPRIEETTMVLRPSTLAMNVAFLIIFSTITVATELTVDAQLRSSTPSVPKEPQTKLAAKVSQELKGWISEGKFFLVVDLPLTKREPIHLSKFQLRVNQKRVCNCIGILPPDTFQGCFLGTSSEFRDNNPIPGLGMRPAKTVESGIGYINVTKLGLGVKNLQITHSLIVGNDLIAKPERDASPKGDDDYIITSPGTTFLLYSDGTKVPVEVKADRVNELKDKNYRSGWILPLKDELRLLFLVADTSLEGATVIGDDGIERLLSIENASVDARQPDDRWEDVKGVSHFVYSEPNGLAFGNLIGFLDSPGTLWIIAEGGYKYENVPLPEGTIWRLDQKGQPQLVGDESYSAWLGVLKDTKETHPVYAETNATGKPIYQIQPGDRVRLILPGKVSQGWHQIRTVGKEQITGWVEGKGTYLIFMRKKNADEARSEAAENLRSADQPRTSPAEKPQPSPKSSATERKPVTLIVRLPANATLELEGYEAKAKGESRQFEIPSVPTGTDSNYRLSARWQEDGEQRTVFRTLTIRGGQKVETDLRRPKGWPAYSGELAGNQEVRVKNPNDFTVTVALRFQGRGKDFVVPANSSKSVSVPNGQCEIYFQYSTDPDGLYQGDNFTLANNGVEIQIVKIVDGNYGIRKVN